MKTQIRLFSLLFLISTIANISFAQSFQWLKNDTSDVAINPTMYHKDVAISAQGDVLTAGVDQYHFHYALSAYGEVAMELFNAQGQIISSSKISGDARIISTLFSDPGPWYVLGAFKDSIIFGQQVHYASNIVPEYFIAAYDDTLGLRWFQNLNNGYGPIDGVGMLNNATSGRFLTVISDFQDGKVVVMDDMGQAVDSIKMLKTGFRSNCISDKEGNLFLAGSCAQSGMTIGDSMFTPPFPYTNWFAGLGKDKKVDWIYWMKDVTCNEVELACGINNDIYVSGDLHDSATVGGIFLEGNSWVFDFFLLHIDSTGTINWGREVPQVFTGDAGLKTGRSLVVDESGNAILYGISRGSIDWGNGVQTTGIIPGYDLWMLSYNASGDALWTIAAGLGADFNSAHGMAIGPNNQFAITGVTQDSAMFGNIMVQSQNLYTQFIAVLQDITTDITPIMHEEADIQIYPNPVSDYLNISSASGIERLLMMDIGGRLLQSYQGDSKKEMQIRVDGLHPGIYILRIDSGDAGISSKKVIVK